MLEDDMEQDIDKFMEEMDSMPTWIKKRTLMELFKKYLSVGKTPVLLNRNDFDRIKEIGVSIYKKRSWPKQFNNSYYKVDVDEVANMCWVEATIEFLNSKGCLKKLTKFDYKKNN